MRWPFPSAASLPLYCPPLLLRFPGGQLVGEVRRPDPIHNGGGLGDGPRFVPVNLQNVPAAHVEALHVLPRQIFRQMPHVASVQTPR